MVEENTADDTLADERGIPTVSKGNGEGSSIGIIIFVLFIAGVLLLWAVWPESEEAEQGTLPAQAEEKFDRDKISTFEVPELPDDPAPLPEPAQSVTIATTPTPRPEQSPEEAARLKAERDLRERRKRSPLVVYDALPSRNSLARGQKTTGSSLSQQDLLKTLAAANTSGSSTGNGLRPDRDSLAGQLVNKVAPNVTASFLADREFIIAQGKMIGGVLETAIQSDLPGMVRAVVSEPVYSEDGRNLLIEKGSRIIGEYRAGLTQGQGRIFVIWNRLITPFGVDIQITSPGTSPLGHAGHGGWIDSHFMERFGASILLSLVGAGAAQSNDDQFNVELGDSFSNSAEIALENSINIRPTLHKNQGDKIKIFVARDLNFKPALTLRSQ